MNPPVAARASASQPSLHGRLKDPSLLRDRCYIDGAWVGTPANPVTNPVNGVELAKVPKLGTAEATQAVEAAERADSLGVDVVNTSLGYFGYDNPNYSHTYEDMDGQTTFSARGANIAFSRGMIMVVSAGNSGNSADPYIATPADAINAFTIGAVDAFGNYASFSSIGPSFDGRVKPDVDAQGQSSVVANPAGAVVTASGTSFSGPIMAGMVASFWQAYPQLTNAQVMQAIRESANLYSSPTDEMGYGIPDFLYALDIAALSAGEFSQPRFVVFPNPASNQVSVLLPDAASQVTMTLYNPLGQIVARKNINAQDRTVSLESLVSGVYLYTLTAGQATQSGKLIKG